MSVQSVQLIPYAVLPLVSAFVTGGLVAFTIRRGRTKQFDGTMTWFALLMGAATTASLARAFQFSVSVVELKLAAVVFVIGGYGVGTVAFCCFSLAFTDNEWLLTRRNVAALSVVPALWVVLAATNWLHGLLWSVETDAVGDAVFVALELEPLHFVWVLYTVSIVLAGQVLLLRTAIGSQQLYRRQALAVVAGSTGPLVVALVFTFDLYSLPRDVDPTPVALAVMGVLYAYAIFRFDLLKLVPVARDTVVENMRDGYVVLNPDDRIVDVNPAAGEILVEGSDELVGADVTAVLPETEGLLADHEPESRLEEEFSVTVDGEQRFLVATVTPLYDDGALVGRLLLLRDVTDRRSVQERYRALIENASDLIFVLDGEGTISYASPSVESMKGVEPDAVVGESVFELVHAEDHETFRETIDRALTEPGEKVRCEYRMQNVDGKWLVFEAVAQCLLDNQFVEGIVVNARDITERMERERELRRTNEQLEQFASVVSHDLRNPINVARGNLDMARETGAEESFDEVEGALERMEAIVNDVLTLARQGRSIGETEPVHVGAAATDAWENVDTERAELVVEADRAIEADRDRLLQLFENCFRNAIEHGSPDVAVTVGTDQDGFYVADDGPGIPDDRKEVVLDSGYTTARDGTGFGLAIVTQIAEAHSWTVTVEDSADGGARFRIGGIERSVPPRAD